MPPRAYRFLIPLAALLATLPLLITGPSCGHDFDFHLLSWLEASTQFIHLHYPLWAYTPAFNAGEPRFLFYPPISWTLGALLGLILPWTVVPAAFTFVSLTLAGFAAHRLCARYAGPTAATFAAVLYLGNPYLLFTAYERTAYGELLAAAWLPLLFQAALSVRVRVPTLALPIALLWLTNVPAAVMACYALVPLATVRLITPSDTYGRSGAASFFSLGLKTIRRRSSLARNFVAAVLLGLALSSAYLLPAVWEKNSVQSDMATITGMRIADNTLFHHMSPATEDDLAHDAVLHTASLISLTLVAAILLLFLITRCRPTRPLLLVTHISTDPPPLDPYGPDPTLPLITLCALILLMLTPFALPLWSRLPELRFLQFPWRLCALLTPILAVFAALALHRSVKLRVLTPVRAALIPILLAVTLTTPAWLLFHQPCDLEDTVPARLALYHSNLGTDPTDEYTPASADNDLLAHANPGFWLAPTASGPPSADALPGQAPTHLSLTVPSPTFLILNRRAFPGEVLMLNHQPIQPEVRDDGLMALALRAGQNTIDLRFHQTPVQTIGLLLTAVAALSALVFAGPRTRPDAPSLRSQRS